MAIEITIHPFNNGNNPVSTSFQRTSCQTGQFYVNFNFCIGLENYSNPLNSGKQITARLEYPYFMSEFQQLFNLAKYKSVEKEGIKKYFPAVQEIELCKAGEIETNRLTMYIDNIEFLSFKNSHNIYGLKYRFTLNFENFYVIHKNIKYIVDLYIPEKMSNIVRKYCAWERFLEGITGIIQMHCTRNVEKVSVQEGDPGSAAKIIALPVNLEMDELNKMNFEQWLTYAQATRSEDLKYLQFLKKYTCNSTTRRTAEIIQPAPVDHEFIVVDPGEEKLPLVPSLVNIDSDIAEIQSEYSDSISNELDVLDANECPWVTMSEEEWKTYSTMSDRYGDSTGYVNKVIKSYFSQPFKAVEWWELVKRVRPGGVWDYKRFGDEGVFEDFGNYHYGIMAAAIGMNICDAVEGAGLAQFLVDLKRGRVTGDLQHAGDQERDTRFIIKGMRSYFSKEYKRLKSISIDSSVI